RGVAVGSPGRTSPPDGRRGEGDPGQIDTNHVFVARQPILDASQRVFGYELLFRSGFDNAYDGTDPTEASSRVIMNTMSVHGLEALSVGRHAFINLTRDILVEETGLVLPRERTVLELLETVVPDREVIAACMALKRRGYRLALDDFVDDESRRPLLDVADMVK